MSLIGIFLNFCKFSLLCFGGGYMLIPLLTAEFVGDGKLLTVHQFGNLVSVSQLTPGPVGINTATFTGFIQQGFWGALAATVGLVQRIDWQQPIRRQLAWRDGREKGRRTERAQGCGHSGSAWHLLPLPLHDGGGCHAAIPRQ